MGRSYAAGEPGKSYKYSATIWRLRYIGVLGVGICLVNK